jgi:hypothetical protein
MPGKIVLDALAELRCVQVRCRICKAAMIGARKRQDICSSCDGSSDEINAALLQFERGTPLISAFPLLWSVSR